MEPNDPQLRKLLREWEVPGAPRSLEDRVLGPRKSWWRFFVSGYIRVPVPVGVAMAVAMVLLTVFLFRDRAAPPASQAGVPLNLTEVNLKDFQPVDQVKIRIIRSNHAN